MDFQEVLFEGFGVRVTLLTVIAALFTAIPTLVALHKLYDRWIHRAERRMQLLLSYLDKEERDISAKRSNILRAISTASQSYLTEREFDVGHELDVAIVDLDGGHPELAAARLMELEKRLEQNERLLNERAEDLAKHRSSVHIFIAALADQSRNPELGLSHIAKALKHNRWDLDAIKYQSILLLTNGDHAQAAQGFNTLRSNANGDDNAGYRADAYLGLATVDLKATPPDHQQALKSLGTALQNLGLLPPLKQDPYTRAHIHSLQGQIYADQAWLGRNLGLSKDCYIKGMNALKQIPNKRAKVDLEMRALALKISNLEREIASSGSASHGTIN